MKYSTYVMRIKGLISKVIGKLQRIQDLINSEMQSIRIALEEKGNGS